MVLVSEEAFAKIRARLEKVNPENHHVVHIYKIKITQNDSIAKIMMLDLVNVQFYEGDDEAECTVTIDDALFNDIVARKVDALSAIRDGRISVEGNAELLHLLKDRISTLE